MNDIDILKQRLTELENRFNQLDKIERLTILKTTQFLDGRNIQVGTTTGTKIGTATTQKLSVYGVTPVVQASAISAPTSPGATYNQATAQSGVDAINLIRAALTAFGITG